MYDRILVAVDGSKPARRAVERAAGLAGCFQARLWLVTVIHLPLSYRLALGSALAMGEEPWATLQRQAEAVLASAGELCQEQCLPFQTILRWGEPAAEILQLVQELEIELLVMGSRGLGQARAHLLGSVSDRCSHECACDLLLVH